MEKKRFANWGEYLFWTYANLNMFMAFSKKSIESYDRSCYIIRAKAFKAYLRLSRMPQS